jgi:multiple sugar transport system substrate-binding protein
MQKAFENGLANFWLGKEDARTALTAVQKRLETIVKPAG